MADNISKQHSLPRLGKVEDLEIYREFIHLQTVPYLRIINSEIFSPCDEIKKLILPNGWNINHYGDSAIEIISPQEFKFNEDSVRDQIASIVELARIIVEEKEWKNVEIAGGTRMLQFILWVEAQRCGFNVTNFTPTEEEERQYKGITDYVRNNDLDWKRDLKRPPEVSVGIASGAS